MEGKCSPVHLCFLLNGAGVILNSLLMSSEPHYLCLKFKLKEKSKAFNTCQKKI